MLKKLTKKVKNDEDLRRLTCKNTSRYKNKVKPFFRLEKGVFKESAGISKIPDKKAILPCTQIQLNFMKSHKISSQYH